MGDAAVSILKDLGFLIAWAIIILGASLALVRAIQLIIWSSKEVWCHGGRHALWYFLARWALPLGPIRIANAFMKRSWILDNIKLSKSVIRWMARAPKGPETVAYILTNDERWAASWIASQVVQEDEKLEPLRILLKIANLNL
jgi:hypothetical protein